MSQTGEHIEVRVEGGDGNPAGAKAKVASLVIEAGKFSLDKGTDDYVGDKKVEEWGEIDENTVFTVRMNNWGSFLPGVVGGLDISVDSYCVGGQRPSPGETTTFTVPGGATMEMVWIEPGTFTMGSPSSEPRRWDNEGPQHEVTITRGFYLGKYELTQEQWESVMGTRPWAGAGYVREDPNHPAVNISWFDVQEFIAKLNAAEGSEVYRLPTEAEWEYACRGSTTTRWSFGDDESQLGQYAWYDANAWDVGEKYAHAVGTKLPNPWGLYDMHGNVYEWVQDWYGSYSSSSQTDPVGPNTGSYRVVRGGSFYGGAQSVRSAYRAPHVAGPSPLRRRRAC